MDAARRRELQRAMVRLADGDRAAFHPVFVLAWPVVSGFARAALQGGPDAEDAAQQGLLKLFERASRFDPQKDALPWILGIVANECRSARRRRERRRETALLDAAEPARPGLSTEADLVRRDLIRAARETLALLEPNDVATILASLEDEPAAAGATYRKRLERARRRLRQAWSARHS